MDVLGSGCSSGCESGWTLYLDQSFICPDRDTSLYAQEYKQDKQLENDDDDEEDSSMVSDASSGPPHFHQDQTYFNQGNTCFYPPSDDAAFLGNKRQNMKEQELPSFLDDTASSSLFNYKKKETASMDYSQGFSSNFEDRSALQDNYTLLLQPCGSGNKLPSSQWSEEKQIGMRWR